MIEMQILSDEKPVEVAVDFAGEYVSGATGEEYQKGYTEGYGKGYIEGETKGFDNGLEQGYKDGYENGFNSAPPDYLPCVTSLKIPNWNLLGKKEVVLNIPSMTSLSGFMQQNGGTLNTTVEHLTINGAMDGTITNISMAFYCASAEKTLKRLTLNCDLSKCVSVNYMCTYLTALEVVDGTPLDLSSITGTISMFGGYNHGIKEVRFVPLSIKCTISFSDDRYLSDETTQSIIDGLADLTGQTAQKVSWHSTVINKLTTDQYLQMGAKNWTWI